MPLLAIVALYARSSWRTARGRFLVCALALAVYLSLGPELTVDGHGIVPLPTPLGHQTISLGGHTKFLPLLDNILPVRFSMYAALAGAVIAALWLAEARTGILRYLLPALAVLLLVPNPGAGVWTTTFSVPPFFTSAAYRSCLAPGEIVLPEPVGMGGQADLWQAETASTTGWPAAGCKPLRRARSSIRPRSPRSLSATHRSAIRPRSCGTTSAAKGVTSVIVDRREARIWIPALRPIAKPVDVGGIILYRVGGTAPGRCEPG